MISRAGVPVYIDYAHTPDALEAAIAALRPACRGRRRLITVFGAGGDRDQGKRPADGRGRDAPVRRGDRHRRQSAQRRPGDDPRGDHGRSARRDRGRRPARGDRRSDPHRRARATSSSSPARATRPARSSATACFRSTTPWSRGNARHERALDQRRNRRGDRRHRQRAVRRHAASRSTAARSGRATCSSPCRARSTTATSSSTRPSPPGAAGAIVSQPVDGPHVLVDDTFAALQALGRAARERSSATIFGVTGSVGKTSTKEALLRRARPQPAGQGPSLGQELQQPHRRAAEPRADAARRRVMRCSKWA